MGSTPADTDYYPITGIQKGFVPGEQVPARMEIDEWWNSDYPIHVDQVSLFIAALKKFQNMDYKHKLSYFQVAGIHGEPRVSWDEGDSASRNGGYCQHDTNLFPTWHRPYLLLFEQRIYEIMIEEIIPEFPENQHHHLEYAAQYWRLPFWDWASKKQVVDSSDEDYDVPQLVRLELVKIRTPEGWKWVKNPLYVFRMPNNVTMEEAGVRPVCIGLDEKGNPKYIQIQNSTATSKYPPTNDNIGTLSKGFINGYQDNDSIMRRLRDVKVGANSDTASGGNLTSSFREDFYRVLGMDEYENFSTSGRIEGIRPALWGSIESLHGLIHSWCGGGWLSEPAYGHMAMVEVAAFDPIFWLHHCNIDRLFAMWQACHPRSDHEKHWFKNRADSLKELKPFRKNKAGEYWNSNDVYDVTKLGYTYPDLLKVRPRGAQGDHLEDLKKSINKLYGATRKAAQKAAVTDVRSDPISMKKAVKAKDLSIVQTQAPDRTLKPCTESHDYIVNIKYERFALKGRPFTIYITIGNPPNNNTELDAVECANVVGEVFNFVQYIKGDDRQSTHCENCLKQAEKNTDSTGQVVLTNALITRVKQKIDHVIHPEHTDSERSDLHPDILESMEPKDVIPFLTRNLHWRITELDGKFICPSEISSLKVAVIGGVADHYEDETKLSKYKGYKALYDITRNRKEEGGACPEDGLFDDHLTYQEGDLEIEPHFHS